MCRLTLRVATAISPSSQTGSPPPPSPSLLSFWDQKEYADIVCIPRTEVVTRSRFFGPAVTVSRIFVAVIAVLALSGPAFSQPRVFVTAGIFADIKRFSNDGIVNTLDSTTIDGGGRVGIFL